MRRESRACRRAAQSVYLPWRNEGGPSTWPFALLCYNGVTLVGSNVSAWADVVTGNGVSVTQGVSLKQPTLAASGMIAINTTSQILTGALASISQPFTVYAVAKTAMTRSYPCVINLASGIGPQLAGDVSVKWKAYAGTNLFSTVSPVNLAVMYGVFNGAASVMGVNGAEWSGNVGTTGASGISIGNIAGYESSAAMDGEIGAILMHLGADDVSTRARVRRWLGRKFGVAVT